MSSGFCGARSFGDTNAGHQQPAGHKACNRVTRVSRAPSVALEARDAFDREIGNPSRRTAVCRPHSWRRSCAVKCLGAVPLPAEEAAKERTANVVTATMIYPIGNAGCEPRIRRRPTALLGTSLAAKRPPGCGRLRGPSVSLCSRPRRASRPCRRAALTMTHVVDKHERTLDRGLVAQWQEVLGKAARASGEPLLFGLRLWASVCLALYVAFWLQLDNAYWAGASAALVCQPHLGASLRKGWFRMIGTVVGAVAIVVLTACFPQDRVAFLVGLALWGATCALGATLLRNFAAYAAALAGFTAAIIASDELGATGGANGQAFMLAISRVSEIWIGIVCAGVVLATTDFGSAPRRLATLFAALATEIWRRFTATLAVAGRAPLETQQVRREFARRVIELDPIIDEAIGESSRIRARSPVLQRAVAGLFTALAAWRKVGVLLSMLPDGAARHDADAVLGNIPPALRTAPDEGEITRWMADPAGVQRLCDEARRTLIALPVATPSLRLLADQIAEVLASMCSALDALMLLLAHPSRAHSRVRGMRFYVPDWQPALVNAARAFLTIGAAELFWIITQWPSGAAAITWTTIAVVLFAPVADEAYARTVSFMAGTAIAAVGAAIVKFAVLPAVTTFAGFSTVIGLYLVPVGALMAKPPWQTALFVAMVANFVPLIGPTNQMSYDTVQFYDGALAIVGGVSAAALSFRLLPPLSPAYRTRRLWSLTLRDLRRLAARPGGWWRDDWEGRIYSRLSVMPNEAAPLQRAQLLAAVAVGADIIELRPTAIGLGQESELETALAALAAGKSAIATAGFARLDQRLASLSPPDSGTSAVMRARGRILAISDTLIQHRSYFDAGVAS
jgi:uncharacterized membrane protein YccC